MIEYKPKQCTWKNHKSATAKIDLDFDKELEDISIERIKQNLEREMLPKREITRMIRNTVNWQNVKQELMTKPRKKE